MNAASQIANKLITLGLPVLGGLFAGSAGEKVGKAAGHLVAGALGFDSPATTSLNDIATSLDNGVGPESLTALQKVEMSPEVAELHKIKANVQKSLFEHDSGQGFFAWAWRPIMSYMIIVFWTWAVLILPVMNSLTGWGIQPVPYDMLLSFSGLWLAIYGGGHTIKSVMVNRKDLM